MNFPLALDALKRAKAIRRRSQDGKITRDEAIGELAVLEKTMCAENPKAEPDGEITFSISPRSETLCEHSRARSGN